MEGIRAHKRKILICKTVRAVTETVGVIGMAATWIGVSRMTNSSPALLPGATRIVAGLGHCNSSLHSQQGGQACKIKKRKRNLR